MANKFSDLELVTSAPLKTDEVYFRQKANALTASGAVVREKISDFMKLVHGLNANSSPDELDELLLQDDVSGSLAAQRIALWRALGLGKKYLSTQFDKTSDTTLQAIGELMMPLAAGGKYAIRITLQVSAGASGGHKYRLNGVNGLTATSINYYVQAQTGTTAPTIGTRISDLGTTSAGVTSAFDGLTFITGGIVVNTAGDLQLRFAQNASDSTPSSVLVGSWIEAVRIG